ncbi:MAG: hypothetical protein MI757_00805 [Pirellulales bacterium]|nr:hypothetical protein [Pirellulales bacterium]
MNTPATEKTKVQNHRSVWRSIGVALMVCNVVALVVVAIAFRLWRLESLPGVNGDEAWFGVQANDLLAGRTIDWRTPSGNSLPQFFFWPTVALHSLFEPSFALLRTVAVISGLMALPVNFYLCRRAFNVRVATISTIALAILPVNIAYSRFGWETSQTLLFALPVCLLSVLAVREPLHRARWSMAAAAALLMSLLVHPTNVFLAPIVAAALAYTWRVELRSHLDPRIAPKTWLWKWAAILLVANLGLVVARGWVVVAMGNAMDPTAWAEFARQVGRLFSGTTVYEFISGGADISHTPFEWHTLDVLMWVCAGAAVFALARLFRREDDVAVRCLAWGWAGSMLAFFLIGGADAVAPHHERYALWMIAPTTILLSLGIARWTTRAHSRRFAPWVWSAAAWMMLWGFHTEYFEHFVATGGTSHHTFQTAHVEPKQQAYEHVLRQACDESTATGEPATIVCSEWWSYWSLRYLAGRDQKVRVVSWDEYLGKNESRLGTPIWFVEFVDSRNLQVVREHLAATNSSANETSIRDYAGRKVIVLFDSTGRGSSRRKDAETRSFAKK